MHKAKKKYGQNFLRDKNLLKKIVGSANLENKNVIEVGPGQGALTQFILPIAKKTVAYEIDTSLKSILKEYEDKGLVIKYGDFLISDLKNDIDNFFDNEETHLIGNLPYYITTPIIFKFLEEPLLKSATIMVQKEVSDRLTAIPNTKQYNALSVIIQYQAEVKKLLNVHKTMFFPIPKVDSAIVKISKKSIEDNVFFEKFVNVVKASFTQKRKTLLNNLSQAYNLEKIIALPLLKLINLNENTRAESLEVNDFEKIAMLLIENKII